MVPIFNDGEFLGSLGIGINPNFFIQKIAEIIRDDGALFISNENLKLFSNDSKCWCESECDSWNGNWWGPDTQCGWCGGDECP